MPRARVNVLTDTPSREQMLAAVTEAAESIDPDGTVWVYFAGHGAGRPAQW
ncbi:MAG: putative caspase-like protein [Myxococcota bacterium]